MEVNVCLLVFVLAVLGAADAQNTTTPPTTATTTSSAMSEITLVAILVPVMVGGLSLISLLFYLFCRQRLGGDYDSGLATGRDFLPGGKTNFGVENNIQILPIRVTQNFDNGMGPPHGDGGQHLQLPHTAGGQHLQFPQHGTSAYVNDVPVNGARYPIYGSG